MVIATKLIKIAGTFDLLKWTEDGLRHYVDNKIEKEIYKFYHASLELFQIKEEKVIVWVYINALPSESSFDVIGKWLENHLKETDGLKVDHFEINDLNCDKEQSQLIILLD